jgi:hypothetical protein
LFSDCLWEDDVIGSFLGLENSVAWRLAAMKAAAILPRLRQAAMIAAWHRRYRASKKFVSEYRSDV